MEIKEETLALKDVLLWQTRRRNTAIANLPADTELPNPVVWRDLLFAATFSPQTVAALDRRTGKIKWQKRLGRIGSSTAIVSNDGLLYITTHSSVECLDALTGTPRWSYAPHPTAREAFYAEPTLSGQRLYLSSTTGMSHCLDRKNGKPLWTHQLTKSGEMVNGTALCTSGLVITGTNTKSAVALDAVNGQLRWRTRLDENCASQALLHEGHAVVHTSKTVYQLNPLNGSIVWTWRRKGWEVKGATVRKRNLFLWVSRKSKDLESASLKDIPNDPSEKVICTRKQSILWECGLPDFSWGIRAIPQMNLLCILAPARILFYSADTGAYLYTIRIGGPDAMQPSIPDYADGVLYAQSSKGTIYAVTLPDKK